jgi:hypothetical protein
MIKSSLPAESSGVVLVPGYEYLQEVLEAAYHQASAGKGKERHANDSPFHEQRMLAINNLLGSDDGMAYQAMKKLTEGLQFTNAAQMEKELLGAIVYIAGILVRNRDAIKVAKNGI